MKFPKWSQLSLNQKGFLFVLSFILTLSVAGVAVDKKITDLTSLPFGSWATGDTLAIVDVSAGGTGVTKKTTIGDFDGRYFLKAGDTTVIGLSNGGSAKALTATAGGVLWSDADSFEITAGGSTGQYLKSNGTSAPTWSAIDLGTSSVTGTLPNNKTTADNLNTASTIVLRDSSGNFSAGTISATVSGNASTATALAANPTDCAADTYATTIAASGNLTCTTVTNAGLAGSIAASKLVGSDIATVGTITSGTWQGSAVGAAYGGTGRTSLTANNVLLGNGTSAVQFVAPGTTGNVLVSDGSTWTSAANNAAATFTLSAKSTTYTLTSNDYTITADTTSGDFTLSLPAAASNSGKIFEITKTVAGAFVIIDPNASETICGQSTIRLVKNKEAVRIQSDGSNWVGLGDSCYRTCTEATSAAGSITASDGCTDSNPSKATGLYTYTWKANTFSTVFYCNTNGYGATTYRGHADSISPSQARAVTISTSTLTDMDHNIMCYGLK